MVRVGKLIMFQHRNGTFHLRHTENGSEALNLRRREYEVHSCKTFCVAFIGSTYLLY